MERLLYISESQIGSPDATARVSDIVSASRIKNAALNVTGALMFTGTHFAQILEGQQQSLDELMLAIFADARHSNISVFDRSPIKARQFANWSMAYFGPSQYVSQYVVGLLNNRSISGQRHATDRLIKLAHEFSVSSTNID